MRCSFVASKPNGDTVMGKKGYYLVQSRVRMAVMLVPADLVLSSFQPHLCAFLASEQGWDNRAVHNGSVSVLTTV